MKMFWKIIDLICIIYGFASIFTHNYYGIIIGMAGCILISEDKRYFRPICWVKTLWRTGLDGFIKNMIISGCDFVEQSDGKLICKVCEKVD